VKGFSSTPGASEEFSGEEITAALSDFEEHGPQFRAGGGLALSSYEFEGRTLYIAARGGSVYAMSAQEVERGGSVGRN
jgi:hypothetical protein